MAGQKLAGFVAGGMTAAAVWDLIIPAMKLAEGLGRLAFLPAFAGVWCGMLLFLLPRRKGTKAAAVLMPVLAGRPCVMGFVAGTMLYLVVKNLVPRISGGERGDVGILCYGIGFTLVMALNIGFSACL